MSEPESLYAALAQFQETWLSTGWSWDRRFDCVASTFAIARVVDAERAVRATFPHEFTSKTLPKAPHLIADVAKASGGVRSDQRIHSTTQHRHLISYALWWPWGGETANISLRVGIAGSDEEEVMRMRQIFRALED